MRLADLIAKIPHLIANFGESNQFLIEVPGGIFLRVFFRASYALRLDIGQIAERDDEAERIASVARDNFAIVRKLVTATCQFEDRQG